MGHSYLEIFINFNKKLFNWLFDLFDYKVVPNLPNNSSGSSWNWKWWDQKKTLGILDQ